MIKICTICGEKYENRDKRSVHCGNINCKNIIMRDRYKKKTYAKKCGKCGNNFTGTHQQKICGECKIKKRECSYEKISVNILCPKCKKIMMTVIRNNISGKFNTIGYKVCEECKKVAKQER